MKLTRKLIPAFIMLLVSAVLMSTASFAWFSMNETVEATGMQVTADAEFIFLEIKGSQDSGFSPVGTNNLNATLFPVAHNDFTNAADVATATKWYYQFSDDPASSTAATTSTPVALTAGNFGSFVAKTTYEIKLHEGMLEEAFDIHVSAVTIPANTGITIIVAGTDGYQELDTTATDIAYNASNVLFNSIGTTAATVTVYIFFDGTDANVKTDNIEALTGAVEFKLTAYTADHT